jgi:predicted nucleotidyltransferase
VNDFLKEEMHRKRTDLDALRQKYGVARLDLFGSAATSEWRPGESDLDFIVVFRERPGQGVADRYLGLAEDLEALLGWPVDLLTEEAIRNPYFREAVEATRTPVYGA